MRTLKKCVRDALGYSSLYLERQVLVYAPDVMNVCHVTIWTLSLFGPRPKHFIDVIRYCNVSYLRLELIGECCSNAGSLASANMAAKVSFTLASIPLLINDNVAAKTTKQV